MDASAGNSVAISAARANLLALTHATGHDGRRREFGNVLLMFLHQSLGKENIQGLAAHFSGGESEDFLGALVEQNDALRIRR